MKIKYPFIACLSFLCFFNTSLAFGYNLRQISSEDGLSNSAILSICQDSDGFMWFGSCDGLNLYNGVNIEVYKPRTGQNHLSGNLIEDIFETKKGVFWIHTNYGLDRFDKNTGIIETFSEFFSSYYLISNGEFVFVLHEDNHISYYSEKEKEFFKIPLQGVYFEDILNCCISEENELLIFKKSGSIEKYEIPESQENILSLTSAELQDSPFNFFYCFTGDESGTFYVIDENHILYEYNLKNNEVNYIYNLSEHIRSSGQVADVIRHNNDFFVGFKTNGLLRLVYETDKAEKYSVQSIDVKSGIFCLKKDLFQDLIWIGTDGKGVFMYSNEPYSIRSTVFENMQKTIEKPVRCLFLDKYNTLWIGTKGDGILKIPNYNRNTGFSDRELQYYSTSNSFLEDNSVYSIAPSHRDILWIGSENGINYYSYKEQSLKKINLEIGNEKVKYIHSICEINDSTLWMATVGTGVVKVNVRWQNEIPHFVSGKRYVIDKGIYYHNYFFTVYNDIEDNLWFGNRGYGAFRLDSRADTLISLLFNQDNRTQTLNDVFSICRDDQDNMWFGTSYGLVKYSSEGSIRYFNENDGLPNNTVHGILKDSHNNLWLSTNQGIVKFNPERESFQVYNYLNGLKVTEYSDGAFHRSEREKLMFFGGVNGFTTIHETGIEQQDYYPAVNFYGLSIYGTEYNINDFLRTEKDKKVLTLTYKQNFFTLYFSALDYLNGNNYTFRYKLEGVSNQWIETRDLKGISFTNLSPGEYPLFVKYFNQNAAFEGEEYSILIRIIPPWYKSTWAYLLYVLVILFAIFFLVRGLIIKTRNKRIRMLEKLNVQHKEKVYESKLQFFTNIAREFSTPLTLIYGPCNRILSYKGTDSFIKGNTEIIQRNAVKLNELIHELIEFKEIEAGSRPLQIENISLTDMIHLIVDAYAEFAQNRNISLSLICEPAVYVKTDQGLLFAIISNIISYVFSYTQEDGKIEVEVLKGNDSFEVNVSNYGKGIGKEELEKFFDTHKILDDFENKEESSRNSLGIAIALSRINLLDGKIIIDTEGEKNIIRILLPEKELSGSAANNFILLPEMKIREQEKQINLPEYTFDKTKPTMMIVDSDTEILWLICEVFTEEYNVVPLSNPSGIPSLMQKYMPDIIIHDFTYASESVISFTREIKAAKNTAHIPVILISARQTMEDQILGLSSGAERYITKPFNVDYLKLSVKQLMSRKDTLKNYFSSPISAYDLVDGKYIHKENQKFIQKILTIIDENIQNPELSSKFIATKLGISTRHLSRKMTEMELKLPDIIRECRLRIVSRQLIETKLSIDEIIHKCGFMNRATFFKIFSDKYNCTPKEYRIKNTIEKEQKE